MLFAFVGSLFIVANNQSPQQKAPSDKKETARAAASLADDIIGDNKSRTGTIEPAKAACAARQRAAGPNPSGAAAPGTPPVMVARADAPPTPPAAAWPPAGPQCPGRARG